MDDLIARLRRHAKEVRELPEGAEEFCVRPSLLEQAADEIERLRALGRESICPKSSFHDGQHTWKYDGSTCRDCGQPRVPVSADAQQKVTK